MQNTDRITKILDEMERLWKRFPEMRFCQLIQLLHPNSQLPSEIYYEEDKEFYERAKAFYGE